MSAPTNHFSLFTYLPRRSPWHTEGRRRWVTLLKVRAVSSVVEHLVYTERVGGSKPSPPILRHQRSDVRDQNSDVLGSARDARHRELSLVVPWHGHPSARRSLVRRRLVRLLR